MGVTLYNKLPTKTRKLIVLMLLGKMFLIYICK